MLPNLVFIHGANATSHSFNYLLEAIKPKKYTLIDYQSSHGFYNNLNRMKEELSYKGKLFIVAHSLGGIYAVHLLEHLPIMGAVTLATPYGGSGLADWAKLMVPTHRLFHEVGVRSKPIVRSKEITISVPWLQIVTTAGRVPWILGDNDGLVARSSMTAKKGIEYKELPYNHYEIMASPEAAQIIGQRYHKAT